MVMRVLQHILLLLYLFLTLCALCYTLFRVVPFDVPWPFITHQYAMQAPFQNYTKHNLAFIAEGQRSTGDWENINLTSYVPFGRGEAVIRMRLSSFHGTEKQNHYNAIAHRILILEEEEGRHYSAVRLVWEKWPKSQDGYYVHHTDEEIERTEVAHYVRP